MRKTIEWTEEWAMAPIPLPVIREFSVKAKDSAMSLVWCECKHPSDGTVMFVNALSRSYTGEGLDVEDISLSSIWAKLKFSLEAKTPYTDREPGELETIEKLAMMDALGLL